MTNPKTSLFGGALFFPGLATDESTLSADGRATRRGRRTLVAALVATTSLVFVTPAIADIIHVPNDFPTIQGAIDASVDGDEVVVAPGEYVESIDFLGKTIILRSVHGREVTIIDGNEAGTVVTCDSGEGPGTTLQGFTVANGDNGSDTAGGMRIGGASTLTVTDCTFAGNYARKGGGMVNDGNVALTNCIFEGNLTVSGYQVGQESLGGGLLNGGYATIIDCSFHFNSALSKGGYSFSWGGGILNTGYALILNSSFDGNYADYGGGLWRWNNSNLSLIGCTFTINGARGSGGGAGTFADTPTTIINSLFIRNAAHWGAGVEGDATIVNCAFIDNRASTGAGVNRTRAIINCTFIGNDAICGGGVVGDARITNSLFIGNEAFTFGGGVVGNGVIRNSIFWGNTPDQIDGDALVTYSNVQGGWPGQGNIDADPLFVDPDNGDYRLSPGSPCIDAGDNTAVPLDEFDLDEDGDTDEATPIDLDGNPRFVDDPATKDTGNGTPPIVDMGAYEFQVVGSCTWDLNGDDVVGTGDLILLLGSWGDPYGTADLIELLGNWGPCPK